MRITFGIIVLNGEPFIRYCLRGLLPFAHQIIVVEGPTPNAKGLATEDGHSRDTTLQTIRDFQKHEDPENKVVLVTAEDEGHPDGFWPGEKDEMSRAYAKRATGDWLWQVDGDEFYHPDDMKTILNELEKGYTAASFNTLTFWGDPTICVDGIRLRGGGCQFRRMFKWGPGYTYLRHRPPTVLDETGRDVYKIKPLTGDRLQSLGVRLFHYSLLFPKQVLNKSRYYEQLTGGARNDLTWVQQNYLTLAHPYHVHNMVSHWSWLDAFVAEHPPAFAQMMQHLHEGVLQEEKRDCADARALLNSRAYRFGRGVLKLLSLVAVPCLKLWDRRPPVKRWLGLVKE